VGRQVTIEVDPHCIGTAGHFVEAVFQVLLAAARKLITPGHLEFGRCAVTERLVVAIEDIDTATVHLLKLNLYRIAHDPRFIDGIIEGASPGLEARDQFLHAFGGRGQRTGTLLGINHVTGNFARQIVNQADVLMHLLIGRRQLFHGTRDMQQLLAGALEIDHHLFEMLRRTPDDIPRLLHIGVDLVILRSRITDQRKHLGNVAGNLGRRRGHPFGQLAHLVGDDGKTPACLTRACRLDGRVECQQIGLVGHIANQCGDLVDAR
jgi:hypothetical protein